MDEEVRERARLEEGCAWTAVSQSGKSKRKREGVPSLQLPAGDKEPGFNRQQDAHERGDKPRPSGPNSPSHYLGAVEQSGVMRPRINDALAAHCIDAEAAWADDFERFFARREVALTNLIQNAIAPPPQGAQLAGIIRGINLSAIQRT